MANQSKNENQNPHAVDSSDRAQRDMYDRGIVPAETAARREREGEEYKNLEHEKTKEGVDELAETGGYTKDNEGLINAYAIEPEMYYEEPGDARESAEKDREERTEDLIEVNEDKEGDLTMKKDNRGKGTGVI